MSAETQKLVDELREQVGGMAQEAVAEATQAMQGGTVVREPDTGQPNPYATKVRERHLADGFYLAVQATCGHAEAVAQTCGLFGHDARAGRCLRCGIGITGAEARRAREQAQARMQPRS